MAETMLTAHSPALFEAARTVRNHAHAPYSRFPVGAALMMRDQQGLVLPHVFVGANVENVSYPEGICAETSAIAQMIATLPHEQRGSIAEICIVAQDKDKPDLLISPCGGCRQRIQEFARPETLVHLAHPDGIRQSMTMAALLPGAFTFSG